MTASLYLRSLGHSDSIVCTEDTQKVGRTSNNRLPAQVSRHSCDVRVTTNAEGPKLRVLPKAAVYVRRAQGAVTAHKPGSDIKLSVGDELYLAKGAVAESGFLVQAGAPPDDAPSPAPKRQKVAATGVQRNSASAQPRSRSSSMQPAVAFQPRSRAGSAQPPRQGKPQLFAGLNLVFFRVPHDKLLKTKAEDHGAVIQKDVSNSTSFLIVSNDTQPLLLQQDLSAEYRGLPKGVSCAKADFVTASIGQGQLLPCDKFIVEHEPEAAVQRSPSPLPEPHADTRGAGSGAAEQQTGAWQQPQPTNGSSVQPSHPMPFGSAFADAGPSVPDSRRFAGGHSRQPWGAGGIWLEPYDESTIEPELQKLRDFWHKCRQEKLDPDADARQGSDENSDDEPDPEGQATGGNGGGPAVNTACQHIACSARPFCIVAELDITLKLYRGHADQFRKKAMQRCIGDVTRCKVPLKTPEDVRDLNMGTKSADKVIEILSTGRLQRNEVRAADPHLQTIKLFGEVWGCGDTTAQKWYLDGARTLEDVKKRTDLTMVQEVGLKYFDALKEKIPRKEGAQWQEAIRNTVIEALKLRGSDAERLFAYCCGSFARGKPATGDIDMVIILPAGLAKTPAGAALNQISETLLQKGLLEDELSPRSKHTMGHAATFMGIGRLSKAHTFRRIDIKVWAHCLMASAINHFIGSGPFARALRYWARFHVAPHKRAEFPDATGFKISELGLLPVQRVGGKERTLQEKDFMTLGSPVPLRSETDIFEHVGLHYIPPHRRFMGSDYQ